MSDAAFRSRGSSAAKAPDASELSQHMVPRASSLFGEGRFAGQLEEREAAHSQIQRSLRAWRKAKDDEETAKPAYIPESGGRPLPGDVRKKMEPKLGADLSGVKLHDSAKAANQLGARAFTVGSDVHFNQGEYNPGTKEGDRLIAHELTHVVQGQKGGIQRKPADEGADAKGGDEKKDAGGAEVSDPAEPAEKEADATADGITEELHEGKDEKGGEKDEKKKDKKDKKKDKDKDKSGLDAANDEEEDKKKQDEAGAEQAGGDEKKEEGPKEAAPAEAAAKLYRKIYLKKPDKASPEQQKQAAELEAQLRADTSAAKAGSDTVKGAIKGGVVLAGGIVGFFVGGPPGAAAGAGLAGAGVSLFRAAKKFLGFHDEKEALFEERQKALDNIEMLKSQPGVLDSLLEDITAGKTASKEFFEELEKLVAEMPRTERRAAERRLKKDKEKAAKDLKGAGMSPGGAGPEKTENAALGAEGAEISVEALEKLLELGHGAANVAHILQAAALGLDVAAIVASNMRAKREAEQLKQLRDGS